MQKITVELITKCIIEWQMRPRCVGKASGRIYHSSQAQQPRREAYETQWEEHEARRHMHM